MSDTATNPFRLLEAAEEIGLLAEHYAPDFYATFPGATPAGLRELTADYAHGNPDAAAYNGLTRDQQQEVLRRVEWPE